MTTTQLPSGTILDLAAACRAMETDPEPATQPELPAYLKQLLDNWNESEREYQAVCDTYDGQDSNEESINAIADARARMQDAQREYYRQYDGWIAVPVEDYHHWLRMEGWVR